MVEVGLVASMEAAWEEVSWAGLGTKALCWVLVYWLWLYTEGGNGAGGCVGWMCYGWERSNTVQCGRSGGCKHRMDVSGTSCGWMCYGTAGSTRSLLQPGRVLGGGCCKGFGHGIGAGFGCRVGSSSVSSVRS